MTIRKVYAIILGHSIFAGYRMNDNQELEDEVQPIRFLPYLKRKL